MEIKPKKSFEDRFPTASVKLLVGSEEVKDQLLQTLSDLEASEELRHRNEEIRDAFEMGRQRAEDERVEAEGDRFEAEVWRKRNEADRILAEQSRVSSENDRVDAERLREDAEYNRVIKERERESAESSRSQAERTRGTNESARTTAENKRSSNESARQSAENVRLANETTRINNENTRTINEAGRVSAEKNRVSAENARQADYENWKFQFTEYGTKIGNNEREIRDVKEDLTTAPEMNGINQYTKTVNLRDRISGDKVYPITIPEAVIDKDGNNVLDIIKRYWSEGNTESEVMYGVEWDVTVADPAMTRIGNMALHRQLPIQNRMKGCLLDDNGKVVEYLPPTSWLGATRDGSRGQVEVELPDHYRKFETDGNIRRAKISEYPLPGYHYVPKMYISAYEATVQRSTNMLCSVVNSDPDYRGGATHADWDGTYRSLLGRPVSSEHGKTFQSWARNRNASATSEWNILDYNCWKAVQWLYLIEYANRNSQLPFIAERDANGNKQGGLGMGATTAPSTLGDWNSQYPFIPCGYTDALGNGSGEMSYTALNEDGSVFTEIMVNRYRGIENPFGHLGKICCGCLCVSKSSEMDIYTTADASLYNFDATDGYQKKYSIPASGGYFKDIAFGEQGDIIPTGRGGSSTTFWCDDLWATSRDQEVIRPLAISGASKIKTASGMFAFDPIYGASNPNNGTRLCFIPKNNE